MGDGSIFDQVQGSLDAIGEALQQLADQDISEDELWATVDTHCQRMTTLSEKALDGDDEVDEEDSELEELRFDDDESDGNGFDDEDEEDL